MGPGSTFAGLGVRHPGNVSLDDDTTLPAPAPRVHVAGLLPDEIRALFAAHGLSLRDDEARRFLAHTIAPTATHDARTRPLAKALLARAEDFLDRSRLEVLERADDPTDGFVKYLFRHPDGALSEAVRIPLHKPGHYSVCLSSQVGCAMQCDFCATGRLGLKRNLKAWEIVMQLVTVRDEAPGPVTGAVFMGQGEPFHNYDEVLRAAQILSHPCGGRIGNDKITISTVGLVPKIRRYTAEGHPYRLIVSLTSALADKRARLMPVAAHYTLDELAQALREHATATGGRVTVAWVLMSGVNSGDDEVQALQRLLAGVPLRVNLIDVNDPREGGYQRAGELERKRFMNALQVLETPIVRRYSGGTATHAACGMLAARRIAGDS